MIKLAKKKQIVISEEELVPTTLAVVQDKKKANVFGMIWIFIIFIIFIAGVIYLPEISAYINSYLNPDVVVPNTPSKDNKKEDDTKDETSVKEYKIANDLEITEESFKISNFNIENNTIKFKITNLTSEVLELKDAHYFVNLYSDNKKLLQRIYLQDIISPSSEADATYDLSDSSASIISLVKISEEEYPSHIVTVPEEGVATLTCTKNYEKVEYLLNNNKVYVTNLLYEVNTTDANFNNLYNNYQALQTTYNNIEGVSSNITLENGLLSFKTIINLSSVKSDTLNLKTIYPFGTDAKVIYFEMTASGYTCS
jgi:hypothetical protein